jgi:hypothetical protein
MIKDAQTKLGGMKKKSKGYKRIELLTKIADMMMLNQVKKKMKNPSPTLGGMINHFGNTFK